MSKGNKQLKYLMSRIFPKDWHTFYLGVGKLSRTNAEVNI